MKRSMLLVVLVASLALSSLASSVASAQSMAPALVPFQGRLANATDGAWLNGDVSLQLSFYASEASGDALYTETQTVNVDDGNFVVYIGDIEPLDLVLFRTNELLYLGVAIDGDAEMTPRYQMASTPFAGFSQYCGEALFLDGQSASDFASATHEHAWSELTGVPADLTDGDSDTTYSAGPGLTLVGTQISADFGRLQSRVTGACPAGRAITSIGADGTVNCAPLGTATPLAGSGTASTAARSDHTHPYLPLSEMSAAQASTLTGGGNADALHTHAAMPNPWFVCGDVTQMAACQIAGRPTTNYEYGIAYNSVEPQQINCTSWNRGRRIYNRHPYFVNADNPSTSMNWGGFMFYTGTDATDDDTCPATTWRHRYWSTAAGNNITPLGGNGCYGSRTAGINLPIYCRERR